MELSYKTTAKDLSFEIPKIKGSRFIGHIFFVKTKEEAEAKLEEIRKLHYQATHNCYAFRVGLHIHQDLFGQTLVDSKFIKASDDGEPASTAAYPMKKVLEGENLQNVLLVVTRYFGGTKLGIGGLIQAYTEASKAVIENAGLKEIEITEQVKIEFPYEETNSIMSYIEKNGIKIVGQKYEDTSELILEINIGKSQEVKEEFKNYIQES